VTRTDVVTEDTRAPWGIAQYDGPGGRVAFEVSHAEIERAIGGAVPTLAGLGIGSGSRVLWCSVLSEAAHLWPLMIGTMLASGQLSLADATAPDALRVAMFLRRLPYQAVMGVNDAVLDGLDELGHAYGDVFAGVAGLGARPGAYERLRDAGLAPQWFVLCGPAVAIAPAPGEPARVDPGEWSLAVADDGRILVTSLQPRATSFDRAPTALRGELVDESAFVPDGAERGSGHSGAERGSGHSGAERGSGHEVRTPERPEEEVRTPERPEEPPGATA
jgi:hypothetical protein